MKKECFFLGMDVERFLKKLEDGLIELAKEKENLAKLYKLRPVSTMRILSDLLRRAKEECGVEYSESEVENVFRALEKGEAVNALIHLKKLSRWMF